MGRAAGTNRREFLLAGAAGGAAALMAGCGGGEQAGRVSFGEGTGYTGGPVQLDFWNGFTGGDGDAMLALIEGFAKDNPKISVAMNTVRWEDYYTKVPAAVSSGEGPDLGVMHVDQLATSAAHGVIVPLDDVTQALGLQEADFAPDVWRAGEYQGKRYGIPLDMHPLGFYFNKDVLEKAGLKASDPPQTRADYEATLRELKAAGVQGQWMTPFFFTGGLVFQSLLWQFGGDLFDAGGSRATWNSDAGVEALNWMTGLIEQGHSPPDIGQDADNVAFKNGSTAFIWNGIWGVGDYGATEGLNWGVAPLPRIGSERAAWSNSHNFVVMRQRRLDADKLQASKVFIDTVTRRSAEWALGGQVPARKSARESEAFAKLEAQSEFAKQVPYLRFPPAVPGIVDVRESTLDVAVNEAVLRSKRPRQALDESAGRADELLRLNREKFAA